MVKAVSHLYKIFERLTAPARKLPDFLIIGAQKAGTTSLYALLKNHPEVVMPRVKEIHFFDNNFSRGIAYYRSFFSFRANSKITGEASPYYLFHPLVPERVVRTIPQVKIIAILRDPIDRTISQYKHNITFGYEELTLEQALQQEKTRLRDEMEKLLNGQVRESYAHRYHSYVARSKYKHQIDNWSKYFPKEQFLLLDFDDLQNNPQKVLDEVAGFLGIGKFKIAGIPVKNKNERMVSVDREIVSSYFSAEDLDYRRLLRR